MWWLVCSSILIITWTFVCRRPCSDDTYNKYYLYNQNFFILHKIMAYVLRNILFYHPALRDLYGRVLIAYADNLVIILHLLSTYYTSRINLYNTNWWDIGGDIVKYVAQQMCRFHVVMEKKISINIQLYYILQLW